MKDGVVQFDRHRRSTQEVLDEIVDMDIKEILVVITTEDGVLVKASSGMDRLRAMGALLAGAIDRWEFE